MTHPAHGAVSPQARRHIYAWAAALAVVAFATYLLQTLSAQGVGSVFVVLLPLAVAAWILLARGQWWALLPIATSFGGLFWFGFRIYTHEAALALCILALLPLLASSDSLPPPRRPLPLSAYLLMAYMLIHLAASEYLCLTERTPGAGGIFRVYLRGLWPVLFLVLMTHFGSTRRLGWILAAMYAVALARVVLGLMGYYLPRRLVVVPLINFILPAAHTAGTDLRVSAILLLTLSLCYYSIVKNRVIKGLFLVASVLAGWIILLGGSRISLIAFLLVLLIWMICEKRFVLLAAALAGLLAGVYVLNQNPLLIYRFPDRVQRTLTALVMRRPTTDVHRAVQTSDEWHFDLMRRGRTRWLHSAPTFLIGNRVHPFDENAFMSLTSTFQMRAQVAASVASYEAGLWTVLAVLGLAGGLLYVGLFAGLLKGVLPSVLRNGIRDVPHAYYFVAVSGLVSWITLCWVVGHFPSSEVMMAAIAKAAHDDAGEEGDRG